MTGPITNETLSAYLDGELSPAELGDVERELQGSADLRARLADLAEVSKSIQQLQAPPAPSDLHVRILDRLPAAAPRQSQSNPVAASKRNLSTSTTWKLAGPVVAAAVLLGMLGWALQDRDPQNGLAVNDQSGSAEMAVDSAEFLAEEAAMGAPAEADSIAIASAQPEPKLAMSDAEVEDITAKAVVASNAIVDGTHLDFPQMTSMTREQLEAKLQNLDRPIEPGDVFSVRQGDSDETPVLVEFTVVDVMNSLPNQEGVSVLFRRQSVADAKQSDDADSPKMVAILVETDTADTMTNMLSQIPATQARVYVNSQDNRPDPVPTPQAVPFQDPTIRNFQFNASILNQSLSPLRQIESDYEEEELSTSKTKPAASRSPEKKDAKSKRVRAILLFTEGDE